MRRPSIILAIAGLALVPSGGISGSRAADRVLPGSPDAKDPKLPGIDLAGDLARAVGCPPDSSAVRSGPGSEPDVPKGTGKSQAESARPPVEPSRPGRPHQSPSPAPGRPKSGAAGQRTKSNRPAEFQSGTEIGTPLIPGQARYPINLPCALRLAGARSIDIRIAQERICRAIADWEQLRVAFLPTLTVGPDYIRHDGRAQMVNGPIFSVSKSSLFAGSSLVAGDGFPGPAPGGGPAPNNALALVFNFADAIFQPLAARQVVRARRAEADAVAHDILLNVSEVYFNLLSAQGQRAIAREAFGNARDLARLIESYVRSGLGLEADYRRVLTEVDTRRHDVEFWEGQFDVASADLVRLLRLDPTTVLEPVEPPGILVSWLEDRKPLGELIALGRSNRPELAADQALAEAARARERAARLHPLLPGAVVRYSGGSFGGGRNSTLGDFGGRSDLEAGLFWELRNLGLGDRALVHAARSDRTLAILTLAREADLVAAEVAQADTQVRSARRQVEEAARTIPQAIQSLRLNFENIRRAAGLPQAVIPLNVLQPIQALAQARSSYLQSVMDYNRAQFRLYRSVGYPPLLAAPPGGRLPNCPLPVPSLPRCSLPIPLRACGAPGPTTPNRSGPAASRAAFDANREVVETPAATNNNEGTGPPRR